MVIEKELSSIAWDVPEKTYREDPALSYSTLARFEREGFDNLDKLFEQISTPALQEGSMVDCLITGSREEFDELYYIVDLPSLGDKELQIANYLFENYSNNYGLFSIIPYNDILQAANAFEFQKNWKDETRVRVLKERCEEYYSTKYDAGSRIIVSIKTYNDVMNMVEALRTSPATSGYFADNDEMSPIRRYYQLKFKAIFDNVAYRCMADCIVVDYEDKRIIPIDLKTSGHTEHSFEDSFIKWQYMIQARLYWRIIRANLDNDPYFKDFDLDYYRFVVVNKNSLTPLVWMFPLTKSVGTLIDKYDREYRDPFEIGKELRGYLDCKPPVPNGISIDGINTIECLKLKE